MIVLEIQIWPILSPLLLHTLPSVLLNVIKKTKFECKQKDLFNKLDIGWFTKVPHQLNVQ
jgi:hypothetical protein